MRSTGVPRSALMSRPAWNSVFPEVHGDGRLPNSELTAPRTGQRDGSAARARPAFEIIRSRALRLSVCSRTPSPSLLSSSAGDSRPVGRSVPGAGPPTPLSRPPGVSSGPNGSQIFACRSRHPAISWRRSATRRLKRSMAARCSMSCWCITTASRVSSRSLTQSPKSAAVSDTVQAIPTKAATAAVLTKLKRRTRTPSPRTMRRLNSPRRFRLGLGGPYKRPPSGPPPAGPAHRVSGGPALPWQTGRLRAWGAVVQATCLSCTQHNHIVSRCAPRQACQIAVATVRGVTSPRPRGYDSRTRHWRKLDGRVLPHQAPAPVRLRDRQRSQDQGARPGRGHHRPGHGQPGHGDAQAHRRQARRGRQESQEPSLLRLARYHPPARGHGQVVPRPLRGGARPRFGGHRHHRRQGGHGAPGAGGAPAGRRRAGAEPDLSDPRLFGGHRRRRPALGAADAGRRLLRAPSRNGAAGVAEGQAADPVVPAQPHHDVRGSRLLRQGRRLRARAPAHGRPRLRLRRLHVRRLPPAVVPRGAGRQGRRRRDLLDLEVLQHGGLAARLRLRQRQHDPRPGPHQVVPRLRRLPADPDRRHRGAGGAIRSASRRSSRSTASAATCW